MSAAAIIDGIGLVGSALGIIGFFQDNLPGEAPPMGAAIRIKAGNPGDDDPGVGGDVRAAYAWDTNNNYLGESSGGGIDIGGTLDTTIDSFVAGSRADFTGVAVDNNALCISWITVSQYDGTPGGAWTGDVGYNCGQNWFMNTEKAGYIDPDANPKQDYIPMCTWLDGDHTEGVPSAALKFRTDAYGGDVQATVDGGKGCDSTIWGADTGPINGTPGKRGISKRGIANKPRKPWMEDVLIVSTIPQHKAALLCNSETSWGPDFVGSDGQYCDMDTHTLAPLCSTANVNGCVNLNNNGTAITKRSVGPKRAVEHPHKEFAKVKNWA